MGDINIDLIKYESHQPTSGYMLYSNLCFPVITQPTRITDYTSTLINHMYTNALDKCITAGICLTDISDHFPIFLIIEEMKILDRSKKKIIRDFKNFQTETFRNDLQEINWDHLIDSNDVNGSCKNFIDAFVSVINKHAPYRKITKQEHKLFHKPWITPAIFTSIKHKQRLYYSHFLKGDVIKKQYYKTYANKLTHLKELSKRNYFREKISKLKNNAKEMWKTINQITKIKNKQNTTPQSINYNGKQVHD